MLKIMFYMMMFVCLFVSLSRIIQKVVEFWWHFLEGCIVWQLHQEPIGSRWWTGSRDIRFGFGFGLQLPWWMFALSRCFLFCTAVTLFLMPRAGPWVVRIDLLRFLAGCCTRRLNQTLSLFLYLSLTLSLSRILSIHYVVLLFIRTPFYVLLVFVGMCSVFWLF